MQNNQKNYLLTKLSDTRNFQKKLLIIKINFLRRYTEEYYQPVLKQN